MNYCSSLFSSDSNDLGAFFVMFTQSLVVILSLTLSHSLSLIHCLVSQYFCTLAVTQVGAANIRLTPQHFQNICILHTNQSTKFEIFKGRSSSTRNQSLAAIFNTSFMLNNTFTHMNFEMRTCGVLRKMPRGSIFGALCQAEQRLRVSYTCLHTG